jgi:hypothetical protein
MIENKQCFYVLLSFVFLSCFYSVHAGKLYAGIEIGATTTKFIVIDELANNKVEVNFTVIKDSVANTNFSQFNEASYTESLLALKGFIKFAQQRYAITNAKIFVVFSNSLYSAATLASKNDYLDRMVIDYNNFIKDQNREIPVISTDKEIEYSLISLLGENSCKDALLFELGNTNSKIGFYNDFPDDFAAITISLGAKTLVNDVTKKTDGFSSTSIFLSDIDIAINKIIKPQLQDVISGRAGFGEKNKIYLSGNVVRYLLTCLQVGKEKLEDNIVVSAQNIIGIQQKIENAFNNAELSAATFTTTIATPKIKQFWVSNITEASRGLTARDIVAGTKLTIQAMNEMNTTNEQITFELTQKTKYGWLPGFIISNSK